MLRDKTTSVGELDPPQALSRVLHSALNFSACREDGGSHGCGQVLLVLGICSFLSALALTIRTYMPCPFWDEWDVVAAIAKGHGPWSWSWLWSQHNEHRIVIPRLLIWLDVTAFGARNVSLFVELYIVQICQWIAICFAVERATQLPESLKRTLQGIFAVCLFSLNQAQTLTWAFQISFILSFAVGTAALLGVAFIERLSSKRVPVLIWAGLAPIIAAFNLASGLLIGFIVVILGCLKRLRRSETAWLLMAWAAGILFYLRGYKGLDPMHSPLQALSTPVDLLLYVLAYLDANWLPLPRHYPLAAVISLVCFAALAIHLLRNRTSIMDFEWFCLAECAWIIATAILTGMGRLQFGIEQAASSRYQTPAMLYWASLCALALVAVWRRWPWHMKRAQALVLAGLLCSLLFAPVWWIAMVRDADARYRACTFVKDGNYHGPAAKLLYPRA